MLRSSLLFLLIVCTMLWLGSPQVRDRNGGDSQSGTSNASAPRSLWSTCIEWIDQLVGRTHSIRGRLVDATGGPLPNHAIMARSVEPPVVWGGTMTDEGGRFELRVERRAVFSLLVRDARHRPMLPYVLAAGGACVLPDRADILLQIPPERGSTAFVRGRVVLAGATQQSKLSFGLKPRTGDDFGGGFVPIEDPTSGLFEYGPVPPGEYCVVVSATAPQVTWRGKSVLALRPHEDRDLGELLIPSHGPPPLRAPHGK